MLTIRQATLLRHGRRVENAAVRMQNGRITAVTTGGQLPLHEFESAFDARGDLLVPGFIDLQCNGGFGDDFTRRPGAIWPVAARLPQYGVTCFLPTIVTSPLERVADAQRALTERPPGWQGSEPLGLHAEGPYLNPQKKGAHNPAYMRRPVASEVEDWRPETGVRLVTLAVELPGAEAMVRYLADAGVVVSAGHSMASFDEAARAFDWGVTYGTHLFNAMPPLHHRRPGLPGALLADERITIGIIPDGVHLHPSVVKIAWQAAAARLNVVTDGMAAMGMPHGSYRLGGFDAWVDESGCRLPDGTLAGSTVTMDEALRKFVAYTGCSLPDALATLTSVPAELLGIGDRKGRIAEGYDADLVLLDQSLQVQATIVGGEVVYQRQ